MSEIPRRPAGINGIAWSLRRLSPVVGLAAMILLMAAGCGGLPKSVKTRVKSLAAQIETDRKIIDAKEERFTTFEATDEYDDFLKPYAERENWRQYFTQAREELDRAAQLQAELDSLVDKNAKEDFGLATKRLEAADIALLQAQAKANQAFDRAEELTTARETAPDMVAAAGRVADSSSRSQAALLGLVAEVKRRHEAKTDDIDKRYGAVAALYESQQSNLETAQTQLAASEPDYAYLNDGCKAVHRLAGECAMAEAALRQGLTQLDQDYLKVLVDMRIDHFVEVGRTSWDSRSDRKTDKDYLYEPRKVGQTDYRYFEQLPENKVLAVGSRGVARIDNNKWEALRIDPTERWPGGRHNAAEFWINNLLWEYYHCYIITQRVLDQPFRVDTVWEQVTEEFYYQHEKDLGQAIVSKPYGMFEDEAITASTPPGYDRVGNPRYGEWRTDAGGVRVWHWFVGYMIYRDLFWRRPYYYNDWNYYRTNSWGRPYYGQTGKEYGTYGKDTRDRYGGTTFARQGGYRTQDPSARGAGPGRRGGGPGRGK